MSEPKKPLVTEETQSTATKNTIDQASNAKTVTREVPTKPTSNTAAKVPSNTISKLAVLALLIAIAAPTVHFAWQQQQKQQWAEQLQLTLQQDNKFAIAQLQTQLQQNLQQQETLFKQQLQQVKSQSVTANDSKISQLKDKISQLEKRLKQGQPSDWLLVESEYLIRVAARTLWLEHDTATAISLLNDADARLSELNDPAYLSVREVIHQDIKALQLMPKLQTDEIILALMAMSKQVPILPLAVANLAKNPATSASVELSEDISDWQSNLAKTWQKFVDDFIRVRQRSGSIEPLIAPEQQAHLKQNLSLKIQLALWAASARKADIYQQTLMDIEQWLNDFFDMENDYNQRFAKALATLQQQRVSYHYPSDLSALSAIRNALAEHNGRTKASQAAAPNPLNSDENQQNNSSAAVEPAPDKTPKAMNSEGIL